MSTTTGQVGVFWDYENCRPPSNASGYSVMGEIRKVPRITVPPLPSVLTWQIRLLNGTDLSRRAGDTQTSPN
ncbi:hypothetical protein PQX77_014350 [Marasmius sp. AFHP31]|nr:hypothetical protein PQX77_014350 [Marasmius sp. AFHP31]